MFEPVARLVPKAVQCNKTVMSALDDMVKIVGEENITGIALTAVDTEGRLWTSFVSGENYSLLLGAISRLSHRVMVDAEAAAEAD